MYVFFSNFHLPAQFSEVGRICILALDIETKIVDDFREISTCFAVEELEKILKINSIRRRATPNYDLASSNLPDIRVDDKWPMLIWGHLDYRDCFWSFAYLIV